MCNAMIGSPLCVGLTQIGILLLSPYSSIIPLISWATINVNVASAVRSLSFGSAEVMDLMTICKRPMDEKVNPSAKRRQRGPYRGALCLG